MDTWGRWPIATVRPSTVRVDDGEQPPYEEPALEVRRNAPAAISYRLKGHNGLWRSLGAVLLDDAACDALAVEAVDREALTRWVRSYGPLFDHTQAGEPFSMGGLVAARYCRDIAKAWAAPDGDGLSRYDNARIDLAVRNAISWMHAYSRQPRVIRSETLLRHLFICALEANDNRAPMRRCRACNHWLIATRSDRFFCDSTCRQHVAGGRGERGRFRREDI